MTLHDEINRARERLQRAGIDAAEAAIDAELLARTVLGWDRARLISSYQSPAPPNFSKCYDELISRRARREPAAYILGTREFWGRDFDVGPGVLVPRPETELIVEEALSLLDTGHAIDTAGNHQPSVADVGTGTGCLAITLALERPRARVVATDISEGALDIARRNAARHHVGDRLEFVQTNLLSDVDGPFDLVVSNPPYIPEADVAALQPEVRDYEPRVALAGGVDGLDIVRDLLLQAEGRLREGGALIFEFGFGQEAGVRDAIAARPGFTLRSMRRDLQGIPRTAVAIFQVRPS